MIALATTASFAKAQQTVPPTKEELAGITERGRLLNEYDQAAWHATDVVQMVNPKTVEGQVTIAKKESGKWVVVFGRLNEERSRFQISYEADQQANPREFKVLNEPVQREDEGFFLHAAQAMEAARKEFDGASRPYNIAVLPAAGEQLYVYLYPAQTKARVYPLGGDVRYLMSADGLRIVEKRQMHKTIVEAGPVSGKKVVSGMHTHVLSETPEDTDVLHVLTQDPPLAEFVGTAHFTFLVNPDGSIAVVKSKKK